MNILAINTIGAACEVAVATEAECFVEREEMLRGHDARIAVVAETALTKSGLGWRRLDRICVISGPGSFTGIRVGVAFAQGLGLALKLPVFGVSALEAIGVEDARLQLAILPAQRRPPDRTWWAQQLSEGVAASEALELDEQQIRNLARAVSGVVGEAPPTDLQWPFVHGSPGALAAARVCRRMGEDARAARPIYVRAPDAVPMQRATEKPLQ